MPKSYQQQIDMIAAGIYYKAASISVQHRKEISQFVCDSVIANATNVKTVSKFKKIKQKIKEL